eukprot:9481906-Pyramimonas_sp.AAC.1
MIIIICLLLLLLLLLLRILLILLLIVFLLLMGPRSSWRRQSCGRYRRTRWSESRLPRENLAAL